MHKVILDYHEHHNVRDVAEYRRAHANAIARKLRAGQRISVHDGVSGLAARVDAGSWIVDCDCGAGNAVAPEAHLALCFACGAVHDGIIMPDDQDAIESLLLARPQQWQRGWLPGETTEELLEENAALPTSIREIRS